MKVLYVFRSLAVWGGIERILVEKMNYLSQVYGYDVYMLTSDQGNHPVPYHLDDNVHFEDLNIRFHQQYQYSFFRRLWVARTLKRKYEKCLSERICQIKPDIIICTTADHIDSLGKLKGSIPLVVESHVNFIHPDSWLRHARTLCNVIIIGLAKQMQLSR